MVEHAFKQSLKRSGILESIPSYNKSGDYYTVIKVTDKDTASLFLEEAKKLNISVKASRYEEGMGIWVFKAYNKEK